MRFVLATTGSLGDVRPFIALAVGLQRAGHKVRLAGPKDASGLCGQSGVDFFPIDGEHQARLSQRDQPRIESGNTLRFGVERLAAKQRIYREVNQATRRACEDAEAIVYRIGGFLAADSIAERMGVPCFKAGLVPYTPTRSWPSLYMYRGFDLGGAGNRLSYWLGEGLVWQVFRREADAFRGELGLKPYGLFGPGKTAFSQKLPVYYGFSPALLPRPADWPEQVQITGHWTLMETGEWQPPAELAAFLEDGPAPVYIGFGSMLNRKQEEVYLLVAEALEQSEQRAVLVGQWNRPDSSLADSGRIFFLEEAPHEWLMPRMAAAVHHGGIGTTTASIKADLPTIIIPFNYDQPFWGNQIARMGLGPRPLDRTKLSAERLAGAIRSCVEDSDMRQRVREIGQRMRAEDGVGEAVRLIQDNL